MRPEAVPHHLTCLEQWVCWRYEEGAGGRQKPVKAPYCPQTGQRASVRRSTTWDRFETAYTAYRNGRHYDGVGLVLTRHDDIVGIDIDGCIDETGRLSELAGQVVDLVDSYTEISPSGRGLRIFAEADLGTFGGRRKGIVELYNHSRYLTLTGHHLAGAPCEVRPRLPQLRQLYREYLMPEQGSGRRPADRPLASLDQSDSDVLARMFRDKLGDLYVRIYHGDVSSVYGHDGSGQADESRADVLLINALAFYTYQDAEQMRRLLLASPRAQQRWEKWHKRVSGNTIYLEYQIQNSILYTHRRR